ncbi:DJ-1/PfpI family protein [Spirosoma arcticum]
MRNVAILLFNEVEVLDFAGPFEVFGVTEIQDERVFNAFTVAKHGPVHARNGLAILPTYRLTDHPKADIIIVPGGGGFLSDGTPLGTRREMHDEAVLNWVRRTAKTAELVLSVCTGARILAQAGLLDGLPITTHYTAIGHLQELVPTAILKPDERWVDAGKIITSAGVSAGIDMALYVVSRLLGRDVADATAREMQYEYWFRAETV